jgi:hypothetical protein
MATDFRRDWRVRRPIDIPDWALLEQLEKLLAPYEPLQNDPFQLEDSRGTYREATVTALRASANDRGDPPEAMYVGLTTAAGHVYELHVTSTGSHGYARHPDDEAFVRLMEGRSIELLGRAADRFGTSTPPPPRQPIEAVAAQPTLASPTPPPPLLARLLRNRLVEGIVITVVGGLLLALILWGTGAI